MTQSNVAEKKIENPDFFPNGSLREKQLVQAYLSEWIPLGQEYLEQEMAH